MKYLWKCPQALNLRGEALEEQLLTSEINNNCYKISGVTSQGLNHLILNGELKFPLTTLTFTARFSYPPIHTPTSPSFFPCALPIIKVSIKLKLEHQRWNKTQVVMVMFKKKEWKSSQLMMHPKVFISEITCWNLL